MLSLFASGGVTGRFIEEMLTTAKVPWQTVKIQGACRISVTVRDQSNGQEYRFVPRGPELTASDCANILANSPTLEPIGWWQVVACRRAWPPTSTPRQRKLSGVRGAKFALDTSGSALTSSLGHGVSLPKPSLSELETIVGKEVRSLSCQMMQAKRLVESGAPEQVALTLGAGGATRQRRSGSSATRLLLPFPNGPELARAISFLPAWFLALLDD